MAKEKLCLGNKVSKKTWFTTSIEYDNQLAFVFNQGNKASKTQGVETCERRKK